MAHSKLISQTIYGVNNYTEYHLGGLPLIISVPHGGGLKPESIPDRTCNNPTTVTDLNTIELARQIDTSLFNLTGCHPHLIFCNLKRIKLDCNRNLEDGACGNSEAETAWTEFHHFIDTAQSIALENYSGKAFYIDLHGHGHAIQRLELGYNYTASELSKSDSVLNTPKYIAYNSIQNLVKINQNGYSNAEMLRGENALGTLLTNSGFPAVPSQQTPDPGSDPYFDGGYNTINYTCASPDNEVDGLQIECNSTVRNSYLNRKQFADSLASVLSFFLNLHESINMQNCDISTKNSESNDVFSFDVCPNPANDFINIKFSKSTENYEINIINSLGIRVLKSNSFNHLDISNLPVGLYFIKLENLEGNKFVKKLVVN